MPLPAILLGLASLLGTTGAAGAGAAGAGSSLLGSAGTIGSAIGSGAGLLGSAAKAASSGGSVKSLIAEGAKSALESGMGSDTPMNNLPSYLGTEGPASGNIFEQMLQQQIAGGGIRPYTPVMDTNSLAPDMSQYAMKGASPQGILPVQPQQEYGGRSPMMDNYLRELLGR